MTALRALVLLLAVSAACAGKVSGSVRATSVQRAVNVATKHIDNQIAEIENYGAITDIIDEGLERLRELVEKIQEKVEHAEEDLVKAIKKAAEALAKNLNEVIKKVTKIDLKLDDKLEDFEEKAKKCAEPIKSKVRNTLLSIKADAEACAAPQIEEAKKVTQQIRKLIELLESVPSNTIKSIKQCVNPAPPTTTPAPEPETDAPTDAPAPEPETDSPAPEPETDSPAPEPVTDAPAPEPETDSPAPEPETDAPAPEPETDAPAPEPVTDAPAPEPETDAPAPNDVVVFNFNKRSVRSVRGISDIFEKIQCVIEALAQAAQDIEDAPKIVYYLDKEIRDLTSKDTQKALKKCAAKAIAGKGKELQQDAAELAYCLIAPSDD